MTVTVYTFGTTTIYDIIRGAGDCTRDEAEIINSIIDYSNPVSLSGYPADFIPCYNVFADIYVLIQQGHDFDLVEIDKNEDYWQGDHEDPFIMPATGCAYRYHA